MRDLSSAAAATSLTLLPVRRVAAEVRDDGYVLPLSLAQKAAEPAALQRDLPKAEVHILDAGHFALYDRPDEIAQLTDGFLVRTLGRLRKGNGRSR
jgi:pimeloyl-ACP methyl ester carboxylesterase